MYTEMRAAREMNPEYDAMLSKFKGKEDNHLTNIV
jgi:hypothetical protein